MSQDPSQLEAGKVILCARLETISKDAADELAEALLALKRELPEKEPGCLTYRVCQFENKVLVFEEYADQEAFNVHRESEGAKALGTVFGSLLREPPVFEFYREL